MRETPRDLSKKSKRLEEGRNALKKKNKGKAKTIKKLRGNVDDIKESRDFWKNQYQQAIEENKGLTVDIKRHSKLLVEANEKKREKDEQLLRLQQMCDEFKKKMK